MVLVNYLPSRSIYNHDDVFTSFCPLNCCLVGKEAVGLPRKNGFRRPYIISIQILKTGFCQPIRRSGDLHSLYSWAYPVSSDTSNFFRKLVGLHVSKEEQCFILIFKVFLCLRLTLFKMSAGDIVLAAISIFVFIWDFLTWPIYQAIYQPWEKRKALKNKNRARTVR